VTSLGWREGDELVVTGGPYVKRRCNVRSAIDCRNGRRQVVLSRLVSQSAAELVPHCWPFVLEDRVHDGVSYRPVGHDLMAA